jgi:phosphatidylglycerophosphate synthase
MTTKRPRPSQFVILADESANWRIAGLCQLERIVLAINEWTETAETGSTIELVVLWRPSIPSADRRLPDCRKVDHVRWTESTNAVRGEARVLSTRLLLERNGLGVFLEATKTVETEEGGSASSWGQWFDEFEQSCRAGKGSEIGWRFLAGPGDSEAGEREFLSRLGKSQDGVVSRLINRPISRFVTRLLLRYSIHPTAWTLAILVLPLLSFALLVRGAYFSIVLGALLFQLFSILDGCDGEMARARYLESARGARLDYLCDLSGNVLFVAGLGFGLGWRNGLYAWEGIFCAAFIITNEVLLGFSHDHDQPAPPGLMPTLYPRHRGMIQNSGLAVLGETFVAWLMQLTKRDVSVLAFLVLALIGLPQWILHLWTAVAGASLALAGIAAARTRS